MHLCAVIFMKRGKPTSLVLLIVSTSRSDTPTRKHLRPTPTPVLTFDTYRIRWEYVQWVSLVYTHSTLCNTLLHSAMHSFMRHAIHTHIQHSATCCNMLQHSATLCNTLQYGPPHNHARFLHSTPAGLGRAVCVVDQFSRSIQVYIYARLVQSQYIGVYIYTKALASHTHIGLDIPHLQDQVGVRVVDQFSRSTYGYTYTRKHSRPTPTPVSTFTTYMYAYIHAYTCVHICLQISWHRFWRLPPTGLGWEYMQWLQWFSLVAVYLCAIHVHMYFYRLVNGARGVRHLQDQVGSICSGLVQSRCIICTCTYCRVVSWNRIDQAQSMCEVQVCVLGIDHTHHVYQEYLLTPNQWLIRMRVCVLGINHTHHVYEEYLKHTESMVDQVQSMCTRNTSHTPMCTRNTSHTPNQWLIRVRVCLRHWLK